MKVLYAIQGTGNGHLSRSLEIVPLLKKYADVEILVSGIQGDIPLPFPVEHKLKGLSFIFGKKGGVDLYKTWVKMKTRRLVKEVRALDVSRFDLVISDFEPVSSYACYFENKPCIGLSHQAAVINPLSPKPKGSDTIGRMVLKYYAPCTKAYGFHFKRYAEDMFTPVIRSQIRQMPVSDKGHYTVYLPAFDDLELIKRLSHFKSVQWKVFSKHNKSPFSMKNIEILPIQNEAFVQSLASGTGILCGAGFETPAEALFLKKKVLAIPMKNQYEQHCNAAGLADLGVPTIKNLKKKNYDIIDDWLTSNHRIEVDFPDETESILKMVLQRHGGETLKDSSLWETTLEAENGII
jgi:uncharacterized protein (TIGR00661 family)